MLITFKYAEHLEIVITYPLCKQESFGKDGANFGHNTTKQSSYKLFLKRFKVGLKFESGKTCRLYIVPGSC